MYQPRIAECLQLGTQFQPIAPPRSESKRSSYIDTDSVVSSTSSVKSSKEKCDVEIMEKELNKEVKIQNKDVSKKPKDEPKPQIKDELKKKVSDVKNTVKEVTKTVKEATVKKTTQTKESQREKTKDEYLEALTTLDPQILSIIQVTFSHLVYRLDPIVRGQACLIFIKLERQRMWLMNHIRTFFSVISIHHMNIDVKGWSFAISICHLIIV